MRQAFTHYWTNATWKETEREAGEPLSHTAANVFVERGVEAGDRVYVVTVLKGVLHLLGRMVVGRVADYDQADAAVDYVPWEATDHLLASECTAMRFDRVVPTETAARLMFEGGKGPVPLKFKAAGALDEQTLRGVRRLAQGSAELLDALLAGEPTFNPTWPDLEDDNEGDDGEVDVLAPLVEYFDAAEYSYEIDEDGDLLSVFGEEGNEFVVLGSAVDSYVLISIALPVEVPENRRAAIAQTVVRANAACLDAALVLNYDEGTMRCRTVTLNDAGLLDAETIGAVFEHAFGRATTYAGYLRQVIDDERSPKEAFEEAEAEIAEQREQDDDEGDEDAIDDEAYDAEFDERAHQLAPKIIDLAGRSATAQAFIDRVRSDVGIDTADEVHELLKRTSTRGLLQYRSFLPDGTRAEAKMVLDLEGLYLYAKSKYDEMQGSSSTEARLRVDVAAGTPRDEIVERLMRHAGDQGRRFLFRGDIERDILPHLSDPITVVQSEALVRAAQNSHDLGHALRALRKGG